MAAKLNYLILFCVVSLIIFTVACRKETVVSDLATPALPATPYNYVNQDFSALSQSPFSNEPGSNITTDKGATLGRVLFYDGHLSLNNTVACATCHKQQFAFADNAQFSTGFESKKTGRNSSTIINVGMINSYFWDMRADTLEKQVLMPVKNHVEMGLENISNLEIKLAKLEYYPALFEDAFGTPEITGDRISKALSQFLRSMVSYRSKYDVGVRSEFANFTPLEKMGKDLFFGWELPCGSCHSSGDNLAGWNGTDRANIGLEESYNDNGMGELLVWQAQGSFYDGVFKVPSLRNVAVTAPYMHDGRFNTLEEVIEHYDSGVKNHPNLDYRLRNGGGIFFEGDAIDPGGFDGSAPRKLQLTEVQKRALVAFLKTLTDYEMMRDPKFADPFTANK